MISVVAKSSPKNKQKNGFFLSIIFITFFLPSIDRWNRIIDGNVRVPRNFCFFFKKRRPFSGRSIEGRTRAGRVFFYRVFFWFFFGLPSFTEFSELPNARNVCRWPRTEFFYRVLKGASSIYALGYRVFTEFSGKEPSSYRVLANFYRVLTASSSLVFLIT